MSLATQRYFIRLSPREPSIENTITQVVVGKNSKRHPKFRSFFEWTFNELNWIYLNFCKLRNVRLIKALNGCFLYGSSHEVKLMNVFFLFQALIKGWSYLATVYMIDEFYYTKNTIKPVGKEGTDFFTWVSVFKNNLSRDKNPPFTSIYTIYVFSLNSKWAL